jgi:hypothetical protein
MPINDDGWPVYAKLVLAELETNKEEHREMKKLLMQVQIDIAGLQIRAGIWGAFSAAVVTGLIALIVHFA